MAGHGGERHAPVVFGLEKYRRRPSADEVTARVGMAVFLGSWAMLFIALFFAYAFVRARAPAWPPAGATPLPILLPGLNTLVVAASSAAVARAVRAQEVGRTHRVAGALAAAAGLATAFLVLQAVVWWSLWRSGLVPSGGAYPSVFYALTVFHALHVAVGVAALAWLSLRARRRAATRIGVGMWAWYWHFVGAVWCVLYVTVYLA